MSEINLTIVGLGQIEYNWIMTFVNSIIGDEMLYGDELASFLGCVICELQFLSADGEWCSTSKEANKELLRCVTGLHNLANTIENAINNFENKLPAPPPLDNLPRDGITR